MKLALEGIKTISEVMGHSQSTDFNHTGNGAKRWDITFVCLKDAGDMPALIPEICGLNFSLEGTPARIVVKENRKSLSNRIILLTFENNPLREIKNFTGKYDGIVGATLYYDDSASEFQNAISNVYDGGIVAEKIFLVKSLSI